MAEEIVACPGCAKKFKIPEGAPGGTFQCTACNANVPYGKSGKGGRGAPQARAAAGTAVKQTRAPAPAAPAAAASRGGSSRRRGREQPDEEAAEERGPRGRKPKDNTQQTILWVSIGGIAVVALGVFLIMNKRKAETPTVTPAVVPAPAPTAPNPAPVVPPVSPANPANPAPAGAGDPAKPPEATGIGGAKTNTSFAGSANMDALFVRIPDIEGVTPQEREAMDKDVATYCDFDAGKAGNDAGTRLRKLGRKAIPALLSAFETQWKANKWDDDRTKWASYQIQEILIWISKADRPGGDFKARYVPQDAKSVPATDFQKCARMWVNWWNGPGKSIEKFKDFAE